jgi:hypothetical protein
MATLEIDDLDWFDSDSCSELTDDEAQTIQGGRLPNDGGSGTWRPPQPPPPPLSLALFLRPLYLLGLLLGFRLVSQLFLKY